MNILKINNLSKHYGTFTAVNNFSLEINKGEVYGILGPNGSGKTTTLGMTLGVINPSSGDYAWFEQPSTVNNRNRIGAVLEHPIFYPNLSAEKNLEINCLIKQSDKINIDRVLERVGLLARKKNLFSTYSLGMKQRLAIASALLSDPEVLVLDEPTNGLDPQGINEVRELIKSIAQEGKTIIIASHILVEIQKMCSHVAIMKNGVLLKNGLINEIIADKNQFSLFAENTDLLVEKLKLHPSYETHQLLDNEILTTFKSKVNPTEINKFLFEHNVILSKLDQHKTTLEEEFLQTINTSK